MMKRFLIRLSAMVFVVICLVVACVHVDASEALGEEYSYTSGETATESDFEATSAIAETDAVASLPVEIDSEVASEIVEIIEGSETKAEAIIALAEKLGITVEEAEGLINSMLEVGDKYLGETKWWVGFKSSIEEDMQFWVMVAVIAVAALALLWYALSMRFKVASPVRRVDYALNSKDGLVDTVKKSCDENSQTLEKMLALAETTATQVAIYEQQLLQKEEELLKRDEEIVQLKEANKCERVHMLSAAAYNLRMLKLLSDRTAMPLADKATIDLFYAKGIDAIKAELTEADIAKLEEMLSMLDTVGEQDG